MEDALSLELRDQLIDLAAELRALIAQLQDPERRDSEWAADARCRVQELRERIVVAMARLEQRARALRPTLEEMSETLRAYGRELSGRPSVNRTRELHERLSCGYEEMLGHMRTWRQTAAVVSGRLGHLKPTKYARNVFHVGMGLVTVGLYQFLITQSQARIVMACLAVMVITLEVTRRFSERWNRFLFDTVFGLINRPHELRKTNGATYYVLALTILAFFAPKEATISAVLVLAIGDPAATLFGKAFGTRKLWRQKSVVGFVAFILSAALVVGVHQFLAIPSFSLATRVGYVAAVALAGAVAELFTERLDDNFTIPLASGAMASLFLLF